MATWKKDNYKLQYHLPFKRVFIRKVTARLARYFFFQLAMKIAKRTLAPKVKTRTDPSGTLNSP